VDAELEAIAGLVEHLPDPPTTSGELVLLALEDGFRLPDGIRNA
jgi:hypothetical protein